MLVFKIVKSLQCILKTDLTGSHILNNYTQAVALSKTDKYACEIKSDEKFCNLYQYVDLSNIDEIIKLLAEKPRRSLQQYLAQLFTNTVVLSKLDQEAIKGFTPESAECIGCILWLGGGEWG